MKTARPILTAEKLRELVHYDPLTGVFTRRVTTASRSLAGTIAGSLDAHGHNTFSLLGHPWRTGRLAWLYMTGEWPKGMIDHRNTIRSDDRWENLRDATQTQNSANMRKRPNRSGLKGVSLHPQTGKWRALIGVGMRTVHIGLFDCKAAAHFAYIVAADIHFGQFARTA